MVYKNGHTDDDRTIGHVEGRPVVLADKDIQKINHFSETQAIDHIAHCTAKDHGQGNTQGPMGPGGLMVKIDDQRHGDNGGDEK